jgi:hypothetical protein
MGIQDVDSIDFDGSLNYISGPLRFRKHFFYTGQLNGGLLNSIYPDIASVAFVEGSISSPRFLNDNGAIAWPKLRLNSNLPNPVDSFQKA